MVDLNEQAIEANSSLLFIDPIPCLQLSDVAYAPAAEIPRWVGLCVRPLHQWRVIWGPAQDPINTNLIYVAAYGNGGPGSYIAIVIRGTDFLTGSLVSVINQLVEDLGIFYKVSLPWAPGRVQIAAGTYSAFQTVTSLSFRGSSLAPFLKTFIQSYAVPPTVVVTGHSLGGCVTSVLATWLSDGLRIANVLPITFAAPTAGGPDFVFYFDDLLKYGIRYHNTLDAVPHLFGGLDLLKNLYSKCNLQLPSDVPPALDFIENILKKYDPYSQPKLSIALNGSCIKGFNDWFSQMYKQHSTATYGELLNARFTLPQQPFFERVERPKLELTEAGT